MMSGWVSVPIFLCVITRKRWGWLYQRSARGFGVRRLLAEGAWDDGGDVLRDRSCWPAPSVWTPPSWLHLAWNQEMCELAFHPKPPPACIAKLWQEGTVLALDRRELPCDVHGRRSVLPIWREMPPLQCLKTNVHLRGRMHVPGGSGDMEGASLTPPRPS